MKKASKKKKVAKKAATKKKMSTKSTPKKKSATKKAEIPRRNPDLLLRNGADGNLHAMNLAKVEDYFTLDLMAADFLRLIDGKRSFDTIVDQLAATSKTLSKDKIAAEAKSFLHQLKKMRLVL